MAKKSTKATTVGDGIGGAEPATLPKAAPVPGTKILLRRSGVKGRLPSAGDAEYGELFINYHSGDLMLCFKDNSDNIVEIKPARSIDGGGGEVPPDTGNTVGDLVWDGTHLRVWDGATWLAVGPGSLAYVQAADKGTVTNTAGDGFDIPLVNNLQAGLMAPGDKNKLDGYPASPDDIPGTLDLQQVTDNGNTTTNTIKLGNATNDSRVVLNGTGQLVQRNDGYGSYQSYVYHNNASVENIYCKAKGSTDSPADVTDQTNIGQYNFKGYQGSSFHTTAAFRVRVDGTVGSSSVPGAIDFSTTSVGSTGDSRKMILNSEGNLLLGSIQSATTSPNIALNADGTSFQNNGHFIGGTATRNTRQLWESTLTEEQKEELAAGTLAIPANVSTPGDGSFIRQWWYDQQSAEDQALIDSGELEYPEKLQPENFVDEFALGDNTKINLTKDGRAEFINSVYGLSIRRNAFGGQGIELKSDSGSNSIANAWVDSAPKDLQFKSKDTTNGTETYIGAWTYDGNLQIGADSLNPSISLNADGTVTAVDFKYTGGSAPSPALAGKEINLVKTIELMAAKLAELGGVDVASLFVAEDPEPVVGTADLEAE